MGEEEEETGRGSRDNEQTAWERWDSVHGVTRTEVYPVGTARQGASPIAPYRTDSVSKRG